MSNKQNDIILESLHDEYLELGGSNKFLRFLVAFPTHIKIQILKELNEMLDDGYVDIKYSREVHEYPPEYESDMEEMELTKMLKTIKEIERKTLKRLKNKR
jgi:hypothetical protein